MCDGVHLAEYLFRRLRQVGLGAVHGVPGDYNLRMLDFVLPSGLEWVGNCNELNAGYAADGYARIKGIAAIITTFGVGELSAINAIAGAYAEMSPVVHIVGTPPRDAQAQGIKLHHSLCNGRSSDFHVFARMYTEITVAQENLIDVSTVAEQIDRLIRECVLQSRPVYLRLPMDMVDEILPASALEQPLNLEHPSNDAKTEQEVVNLIVRKIKTSKRPFILIDAGTSRYGLAKEADDLMRITGFPTATTPFGKGISDETAENFHGIYTSVGSNTYVSYVQSCDLVINIGPVYSNANTHYFTTIPNVNVTVSLNQDTVTIGQWTGSMYPQSLLRAVVDRLKEIKLPKFTPYPDLPDARKRLQPAVEKQEPLRQDIFWQRMSQFFLPGDIILTETGTASVGGRDFILPRNATMINSGVWLSIGYMLPASQGVALAQRHLNQDQPSHPSQGGRTILFEGDGSFQMTAQELSTIIRKKLPVIIFIINNNGYTIERLIHGMEAEYNDVAPWRYLQSASYFGAPDDGSYPVFTARASTWGELHDILAAKELQHGNGLRMVELIMDTRDCTETLRLLLDMYAEKKD
jgi:pyruvate decarboxylase